MSVTAAYLTSEGVVLGADSLRMVSIDDEAGPPQVFYHAQKIFPLGAEPRLAVCCWGRSLVGRTSHRSLIAQLGATVADETVTGAARRLVELARTCAAAGGGLPRPVGYALGGWNLRTHEPACCIIDLETSGDGGLSATIRELRMGEVLFRGHSSIFTRLYRGFDPTLAGRVRDALRAALREAGHDENLITDERFDEIWMRATEPLKWTGHLDMPLRDAVDFVFSFLHMTAKAHKFDRGGPRACGGAVDIAVVPADEPFRWVRCKPLDSALRDSS